MNRSAFAGLVVVSALVAGCAAEPATSAHENGDVEEDPETPDNAAAGRDSTFESCMAACQNASFSCNVGGVSTADAFLAVEALGCRGELTASGKASRALAVECRARHVCVDGDCKDATFSAMTFAWEKTACTRN